MPGVLLQNRLRGRDHRLAPLRECRVMTASWSWRREIGSVGLWWSTLTLVLWLLSRSTGQPTDVLRCAASAALLVTVGEVGDRLRRKYSTLKSRRGNRC
ncbi:hypothetical protein ACQPZG_00910 (plasmid) [Streptomyces sp. CA-294286]|uniref:hypothetical protein n=1 Tax=Streptomyces sp. CA-294286 TaxID=3240070 RepID=UPI003D912421